MMFWIRGVTYRGGCFTDCNGPTIVDYFWLRVFGFTVLRVTQYASIVRSSRSYPTIYGCVVLPWFGGPLCVYSDILDRVHGRLRSYRRRRAERLLRGSDELRD